MFIFTAKLHRKRIVFGAVALVLVCGLFVGLAGFHTRYGAQSAIAAPVSAKGVKTNADRIAYLEQFGWQTSPEAISVEELRLPETLDASFDDYLATQQGQGFDLPSYLGKTVKRYTYAISNHPDSGREVFASLLIYKNTVIAGEVFAADNGEILHGLKRPT